MILGQLRIGARSTTYAALPHKYKEKSTNLPTVKLQIYQKKTTNLPTKDYKSTNNKTTKVPTKGYKSYNN